MGHRRNHDTQWNVTETPWIPSTANGEPVRPIHDLPRFFGTYKHATGAPPLRNDAEGGPFDEAGGEDLERDAGEYHEVEEQASSSFRRIGGNGVLWRLQRNYRWLGRLVSLSCVSEQGEGERDGEGGIAR